MASYKSISKNFTFGAGFAGGDDFNLISTSTADEDSVVNITSGIDSTYNVYLIYYNNVHPSAGSTLAVQFTTDGTNFNKEIKSMQCNGSNTEGGTASNNNADLSESRYRHTTYAPIGFAATIETNAESCANGFLWLFGPANTTFTKHFYCRTVAKDDAPGGAQSFTAGLIETTSAVTGVSFKMSTGDIDAGSFKLYGLSK